MSSLKEQFETAFIDAKIEFTQKAIDDMLDRPINLAEFLEFVSASQIQGIAEHLEIGGRNSSNPAKASSKKRVRIVGDRAEDIRMFILTLFDNKRELTLSQVADKVIAHFPLCGSSRTQRFVCGLISDGILQRKPDALDGRKNVIFAA